MFSLSIENDEMTLWYFSPSHSCVSPTFNIKEKLELTIRIILMFMYASLDELGIDPTIVERTDPEQRNRVCYVYRAGEKHYKTVRSIFEYGGIRYTGRATRVWEVVEVQDADNLTSISPDHFVLKDCWLDDAASSEQKVQEQLFDDIEKGLGRIRESKETGRLDVPYLEDLPVELLQKVDECISNPTRYKDYFLTVVNDWQGEPALARAPGAKAVRSLFDDLPRGPVPAPQVGTDQSRLQQNPLATQLSGSGSLIPRTQHRAVFKEVGTALHHVDELKTILDALPDFLFALWLLYVAGWVHRDISTGNLLCYSGRGILADFEYAKKFDPKPTKEASSNRKTGTAFFMAVEIQAQQWLYQPEEPDVLGAKRIPIPPIIHNYQHDGESLLWLVLWTYLVRLITAPPSDVPDATPQRSPSALELATANIFRSDDGRYELERLNALLNPAVFAHNVLDVAFPPKDWDVHGTETLLDPSEILRSALVQSRKAYMKREYATDNISSYCPVYKTLADTFALLRNHYGACSNEYPSLRSFVSHVPPSSLPVSVRRISSQQPKDDAQAPPSLPVRKRSRQPKNDEDYQGEAQEPASKKRRWAGPLLRR
ncbi:hypothetical protein C8Q76DRAFT_278275 [Earliella scabrosa]|nr:hypothetical protein C8Q76DRAFT_278275 [Earliella scabrosa]